MYEIENILSILDDILNTSRKRHIAGGILISMAALFGGLAITALTIKSDKNDN